MINQQNNDTITEDEEFSISVETFQKWKEDTTTQLVFKYLEFCVEMNKERRLSPTYITDAVSGQLKLNYFLGYEHALSELLNIEATITKEVKNDI